LGRRGRVLLLGRLGLRRLLLALAARGQADVGDGGVRTAALAGPVERHLGVDLPLRRLAGHHPRLNGGIRDVSERPAYRRSREGPAVRPGQRSITALMLVVCAAVGVAIAGVPHRSSEPAIRLSDDAGAVGTDPTTTASVAANTTTSAAPSTTAVTTTTTTRPAKTTTTAPRRPAATAAPTTTAVATTVAKSSPTTVRPTGLNPDGR